MWIELITGKRLYFPDASAWREVGDWMELLTVRRRLVAQVRVSQVAAHWYDTEKEGADNAK